MAADTSFPVTIRLRVDGKGLEGTLKLSEREARKLNRSLDGMDRSARRSGKALDGAAKQADRFGARAQVGANRARDSMGRYVGAQDQAVKGTGRLSRQTEALGKRFKSVGQTLSLYLTAGLIAAAGASVKFATDFESEMTRINTLVGVGREEIAEYRDEILELAPAVGRGPAELAQGLFAVTSAGARGAQAMETLTAAAQASAIGLGSTRDIALAATSAVTAYGEANLSSKEAVEILIGTVEQGNLEASQLAGSLGRVISIAAQAGVSFRDAGAFIAAFTRQGVSANEAVTGLRGVLATLVREPTADALKAFDKMGTSAAEFKQQIADQGFIVAFQDLVNRAQDAGIEMGSLVPEVEALAGAMAVFASEGQSATDIAEQVGNAVGTLESRLQAAREQDPALAFSMMRAELETLAVEIGTNLLPVALELAEEVQDLSRWFRDLDATTQENIIQIAALAAAIGPLLIGVGALIKALGAARLAVVALSGPWGILIGAVAALTIHIASHRAEVEALRQPTEAATTALEQMREATQGDLGDQDIKNFQSALGELNREIEETQTRMENMIEARIMMSQVGGMRSEVGDFSAGRESAELAALQERLGTMKSARVVEEERLKIARMFPTQAERNAEAQAFWNRVTDEGREILERFGITFPKVEEAAEAAGESIDKAGDSAGEAARKFDKSLESLVGLIDEARGRADFYAQSMIGVASALFQAATGMEAFNTASDRSGGDGFFPNFGVLDSALDAMKDIRAEMEEAARIEWSFENLLDSFHPLAQEMRMLGDAIEVVNAQIENGKLSQMEGMFLKSGMAANAAFGAMMDGVDRTAQEYKQLEVAQQAVNVALGIAAIMQQGMGDPYTAIPRMIAMAAMVAQLVDGISGLSGGGGASAEQRQEVQGTGSVLGDPTAESESISNATKITADATSELVGINRAQLRALERMQDGIEGAAGMVARGASDMDLAGINLEPGSFEGFMKDFHKSFDPLGAAIDDWVGGLFGFGKTKVVDQGIALLGGAISDMTQGAVAKAFGDLKRKSLFGSSSKTVFEDLDDAFNTQLNLIFGSMIDTVTAAGEALGIPLDEIQARIDRFEIEAQEISLKDLDADEQRAELEAVFSRIFDDLATSVIPFLEQFQKVGEGMGETMVRVATSVQVTEEAVIRLGLSLEDLDPERLAQVSVGLVEAAGGIEEFITSMESFVDKFAPASHQFAIAESDITRALDQMGLAVPPTRDAMWELMNSFDISTEAGQRQVATLLSLTDAADAYYSELEAIQQEREGLEQRLMQLQGETSALRELELEALDESNRALQERIWALEDEQALQQVMSQVMSDLRGMEWSPLRQELFRINQATLEATAAVRARGGAEEDYALIQRRHTLQVQALAGTIRASLADMRDQLFGGGDSIGSSMQSTAGTISSAMGDIQASMIDAIQGVQDWLDSSLLGNNSPLLPQEQLDAAGSQFWDAISAAQGGDAEAAGNLPQLADQFLGQASSFWGTSTAEYQGIWEMVRDAMQGIADMDVADENRPPTYGQQQAVVSATQGTELSALEQARLAGRMVDELGVLSRISGDSPADIARELGIPIGDLMEAVTGEMPTKTGEALRAEFNDFIEDADAQLSTLGRIEGVLGDIHTAITGIDWDVVEPPPNSDIPDNQDDREPVGKAAGGWSTGIVNTGELGPELILPHDVSTFFQRNGVPVSGGSDPQARALLSKIEQRLAKLEALAEGGHQLSAEQIRAIREGTSETTLQLGELVAYEGRKARKPTPTSKLGGR